MNFCDRREVEVLRTFLWIVPSERVCDVTTEQGTDGRPYFGALRECNGCYTELMATINHIAGSGRKCGRHFHRDHLHISCGLVFVSTVARCCRRAATARGSRRTTRRKCTSGCGRTRAPARPSSNLAVYGRRSRGMRTKHLGRNRRNCEFRRCHPQRAGRER